MIMKLPDWVRRSLRGGRGSGVPADPEGRMQILNLIRKTHLASNVEIAGSGGKRTKGLLGRKSLAPGEGMWIVPCEAVHTFGMQFPIDLVYLDRGLRIKKLRSSVAPWRLSACLSAHSILELPAGTIRESQSQPGDLLEFSPAEAKTLSREAK